MEGQGYHLSPPPAGPRHFLRRLLGSGEQGATREPPDSSLNGPFRSPALSPLINTLNLGVLVWKRSATVLGPP